MVPRDLRHQHALAPEAGAGAAGSGQPNADKFDCTGVYCLLHFQMLMVSFWRLAFFSEGWGDLSAGSLSFWTAGKGTGSSNQTRRSTAEARLQQGFKHCQTLFCDINPSGLGKFDRTSGWADLPLACAQFTMRCIEISSLKTTVGSIRAGCCRLARLELASAC